MADRLREYYTDDAEISGSETKYAPGTSLPLEVSEAVKGGQGLVGDDFSDDQLKRWFEQEKEAFFEHDAGNSDIDPWYSYMRYVNEALGFSHVGASGSMLVIGPGNGAEVSRFAHWSLTFVEASDSFKSVLKDRFPTAVVIHPQPSGQMELEAASQDVTCALSVLHHIPNVSAIIREIARVTRQQGLFLVREPCSSMGDWRKPRSTTPNERGIAANLLVQIARERGFDLVKKTPILFEPINRFLKRTIGFTVIPFGILYGIDRVASAIVALNDRYWRDTLLKKIGPSSYFYVFRKT